jgi:hypothetical protein
LIGTNHEILAGSLPATIVATISTAEYLARVAYYVPSPEAFPQRPEPSRRAAALPRRCGAERSKMLAKLLNLLPGRRNQVGDAPRSDDAKKESMTDTQR